MPLYGPPGLPLSGGTLTNLVTISLGTITASQNALAITATWNAGGVTFAAPLDVNVTSTASATGSLLANLRLGGTSKFSVDKAGKVSAGVFVGDDGFAAVQFLDSSANNIFRGLRAEAWSDTFTGTYFQIGASGGSAMITTGLSIPAARFAVLTSGFQITPAGATSVPAPVALLELWNDFGSGSNRVAFMVVGNRGQAVNLAEFYAGGTMPATGSLVSAITKEGYHILPGSLRWLGRTATTAAPTTTELPNDKDCCIHKDTLGGSVYLAYNDGGSTIKKVALT